MSDLSQKVVEKITAEIAKGKTENRKNKTFSNASNEKNAENNLKIKDPEFSFIFTIPLDGKLNISGHIKKDIQAQNKSINKRHYTLNTESEFSRKKDAIFSDILDVSKESEVNGKNKNTFIYAGSEELGASCLQYFISKSFVNKEVLACWKYNTLNNESIIEVLNETKKRYTEDGGDLNDLPENIFKLTESFTAEVKLFSVGAISILIRNDISAITESSNSVSLSPEEIIKVLKYPNLSVVRKRYVVGDNGVKTEGNSTANRKNTCGFLNIFAYGFASHVFNEFFRRLSNSKNIRQINLLQVDRVCQKSKKNDCLIVDRFKSGLYTNKTVKALISKPPNCKKLSDRVNYLKDSHGKSYVIYRGDPERKDELLLYKQFKDSKEDLVSLVKMFSIIKKRVDIDKIELPKELEKFFGPKDLLKDTLQKFVLRNSLKEITGKLWNAPLFATPYIGIRFNSIPDAYIEEDSLKPAALNLLIATARQTPEYLNSSNSKPAEFLQNNFISLGQKDTIVVEHQGVATIENCIKKQNGKLSENSTFGVSFDTPYNPLIFCLESTLATTKSVSSFNKELEEDVSSKVDNMLNKRLKGFFAAFYRTMPVTYFGVIAGIVFLLFAGGMSVIANCVMVVFVVCHMVSTLRNYYVFNKLNEFIYKARILSPCEDSSYNIINSLKSEIVIKGVTIAKGFGLNTLTKIVNKRFESLDHLLKTCHQTLIVQANWILIFLLLYLGMVNLVFSNSIGFSWKELMKKFGVVVPEHESLIQFLINLLPFSI
ncbi:MAG: hypothetical protein ACUZ8O_16290 [Candidatus Anammoxibacter sp.]